ncbi:MAG TPA: phosphoenolpyruvate--protein phosphotransferase [Steroidobacteraceae bacterium]
MSILQILAPFDGWCGTLDEVPDPVFAGRMLGDGVAIDPTTGILVAPCAGEIVTLPASAHAVSIRTAQGIDVLVHIGVDTVQLGGRGFDARVRPGASVRAGDELIRFDLDVVARGAKSLMTPILVTPMDGLRLQQRRAPGLVSSGEVLFEIAGVETRTSPPRAANAPKEEAAAGHTLIVTLRHGLHARPAALLAQRAKAFGAQASLSAHGRTANARSVVAIMALGVRQGDELSIQASGADAPQSVASLVAGIQEALRMESAAGHGAAEGTAPDSSKTAPTAAPRPLAAAGVLGGVIAVPGIAVGRATRIERREIAVAEHGADSGRERAELEQARINVRMRLERVAATGGATRREIIAAHLEFLDDPQVNEAAHESIAAGKSAGFAWRSAIRRSISALQALEDSRLRERVDDLLDVESHVLLALAGEARPMNIPLPERAVLVADDLLPSELTALDRARLVAICLSGGGATSHVAILAAAMDIPMLVGLGSGIRDIADGATVIVDADAGTLQTAPAAPAIEQARAAVESRLMRRAKTLAEAQIECRALDGTRVEVFANLGNVTDAAAAVAHGAEGCGLLRTEFLFIDRETAPTEAEQLAAYQDIAAALGPRPLILRLMDVGGDKPLRYLPLPAEDNPALGLRGVRTALAHPDLMRTQLRAALRVRPAGNVRLLIPMITDAAEILAVRGVIDELEAEIGIADRVELGAMIETPAAALMASGLIREVDFLSIGSNDLTQYTLAMDRGHPELAGRTDALHPAVLKLVAAAAGAGAAAGKMVAVCGGVAADRLAVPLLLGLGVRELSVVPAAVPAIKRQIRSLRINDCRELALRCLDLASPGEVRAQAAEMLESLGDMQ